MGYYENWQREKYGNVTPVKKSNLRKDEDEIDSEQSSDFDFVGDSFMFDDGIANKTKNEQ